MDTNRSCKITAVSLACTRCILYLKFLGEPPEKLCLSGTLSVLLNEMYGERVGEWNDGME